MGKDELSPHLGFISCHYIFVNVFFFHFLKICSLDNADVSPEKSAAWAMPAVSGPPNGWVDRSLFLANSFFEHRMILRYTWRRREARSLTVYIAMDDGIKKDMKHAKMVREMFQCSDHCAVMTRIRF